MRAFVSLPSGYRESFTLELQKDKKTAILINLLALFIAAIMAVIGHFRVSITAFYAMSDGLGIYFLRFLVLIVLFVVYILLHELTHGVVMKLFGADKIQYGFTGLYAFAGSECFFTKAPYIVIALAPVLLWGVVLGLVCPLLPESWFWTVYFIQIGNISGAAGDFYVTYKFMKMPKDILVKDTGCSMTVYEKE